MAAFLDNCRFNPTSGGTTDWTYSSAVLGYQSPASANVVNGTKYKYFAISADQTQWEIGEGAYNTSTGVLARTTILYSTNSNAKVTFSAAPTVAIVALKEDIISVEEANSFTATQQAQARSNIGSVGTVKVQKFTASATYTPSAGMQYCIIECVGGGGGSGASTGAAGFVTSGGGGGSGSYSRKIASAAAIGASQSVTIGAGGSAGNAGGDTSVGSLCIGKGGQGGVSGSSGAFGLGGAGGIAGTGDLAIPGNPGGTGFYSSAVGPVSTGGNGGPSDLGAVTLALAAGGGAAVNGAAASTPGSGGAGACSNNVASNGTGAAGSAGEVVITEFCTQ